MEVHDIERVRAAKTLRYVARKGYIGGIFFLRPPRTRTLFGIAMYHDRGLLMVYSSALGAWLFL